MSNAVTYLIAVFQIKLEYSDMKMETYKVQNIFLFQKDLSYSQFFSLNYIQMFKNGKFNQNK